jgi:hypothetical protein
MPSEILFNVQNEHVLSGDTPLCGTLELAAFTCGDDRVADGIRE